jgi:capsular exopolysaccharide synthesis family protein
MNLPISHNPNGANGDETLPVPIAGGVPALHRGYGYAGYPTEPTEVSDAFGLKVLLDGWRIFKRYKWLIIGVAAAVFAIGAVKTLMQTPLYTATVRLQIDNNVPRVVERGSLVADEDLWTFMQSQLKLIESRTMAERVASALDLGKDKKFLKPRNFSPIRTIKAFFATDPLVDDSARQANSEKAASGIILSNRSVRLDTEARIVDISFVDPDPRRAQKVANAYADAYIATNIDKRFQANASAKIFLEDKIQQLKLKLTEAERKMLDFAEEQKIVQVNQESSIAETNLASAHKELGELISERTKNEQLWRQAESTEAVNLPQLLSSTVIEELRAKKKDLELTYQQKLQTFKPSYPGMVEIKNQMQEVDRQIQLEVQTIKDSLQGGYQASLAREEELKARIDELTKAVLDLQKRSIQYNILKREADTTRELHTSLLQRYKEVDVASGVGTNNVFVVDRAQAPSSPSSPNLMRALTVSLMLGAVAGFGLAFGLDKLDDKIQTVEEIELASGLTALGVIPLVKDIEAALTDPRSSISESYRSLCTSLQFATEGGMPRSLAITSSGPGEGKSVTSISIARHFASLGQKVLLVDADLRKASLHEKLGTDNSRGFSNYLTGACSPPEVLQKTNISNLAFMASGPLPPNAADLLAGTRLHSLLSIGAEVFDLIILDGPPVLGLADAQLLSNAAEGTIFVAAAGLARTGHVRGALRRLQLSRGLLIGAVLTKYSAKVESAGYGYGYGYGYGDTEYGRQISAELEADPQPKLAHLR